MNDFNSAEYVVTQAKEGKNRRLRVLLMTMYLVVIIGLVVILLALKLVPVVAVVPLLAWPMVHFTWRKVNVEYKYVIAHSRVTFSECFSSGSDKVTIDVQVADFDYIGKLEDSEQKIRDFAPTKTFDYRGSVSKPNAAVGLLTQNGAKTQVLFIYDKRTASLFKLYNKNTEL